MTLLDPTAGLDDFDAIPGLREAWSKNLSDLLDYMNYGGDRGTALFELQKWGCSDSDIRFFNPLSMPIPAGSADSNVPWQALPTSFDQTHPDKNERYDFLDNPQIDPQQHKRTRVQDEYNEWVVVRENGKIKKAIFTSEPAAYYEFLANDPYGVGKARTQGLLLDLYRRISGDNTIQLGDLLRDGRLDNWNKWNNMYCIHMQQPNNTLGAEVNIAARAAILRKDVQTGAIKTDAYDLIGCARYGEPQRQSDPSIGSAVNAAVRENRFLTLQNPIGLYMTSLDTRGWTTPDGKDAQQFWQVLRGKADADPLKSRIVRAEFSVPAALGYTVSDIKIGGAPIKYGAQIAAKIGMRLGVTVSPPSNLPPPRAIGCVDDVPPQIVAARPSMERRA